MPGKHYPSDHSKGKKKQPKRAPPTPAPMTRTIPSSITDESAEQPARVMRNDTTANHPPHRTQGQDTAGQQTHGVAPERGEASQLRRRFAGWRTAQGQGANVVAAGANEFEQLLNVQLAQDEGEMPDEVEMEHEGEMRDQQERRGRPQRRGNSSALRRQRRERAIARRQQEEAEQQETQQIVNVPVIGRDVLGREDEENRPQLFGQRIQTRAERKERRDRKTERRRLEKLKRRAEEQVRFEARIDVEGETFLMDDTAAVTREQPHSSIRRPAPPRYAGQLGRQHGELNWSTFEHRNQTRPFRVDNYVRGGILPESSRSRQPRRDQDFNRQYAPPPPHPPRDNTSNAYGERAFAEIRARHTNQASNAAAVASRRRTDGEALERQDQANKPSQ